MISRWIAADGKRTNSLALTQHRGMVPKHLSCAIAESGGRIFHINHERGGLLEWALELRRLAKLYDVIVLHIYCEDVIPLLAFAEPRSVPPVLLLNHADHLFWFGPAISHGVISLRHAAKELTETRRAVDPQRSFLLPTIVDATVRKRTRLEAKRALGLEPDRIHLVSVARATKYRTVDGVTYADLHVPVLNEHPKCELIVVGASQPSDWGPAIAATGGRIRALPNQSDPTPYYEAADIYVDSYPFVSSTSMMEAAGYGVPLVTIFKAPDAAQIFGINHVGLVGTALLARSDAAYVKTLSDLVSNAEFRERAGHAACEAIQRLHVPPGWLTSLESIYERSMLLPPLDNIAMLHSAHVERPHLGEPDRRHEDMFRSHYPMSEKLKGYMGMAPLRQQLAYWNELRRAGAFHGLRDAVTCLVPEWLRRWLKDRV